MVVTRNLSVTVKKTGGLTMKTLEGILSKDEANDSNTKVRSPIDLLSLSSGRFVGLDRTHPLDTCSSDPSLIHNPLDLI